MYKQLLMLVALAVVLLAADRAVGQARWGGGDGNWTDDNWSGGSGPGGAPGDFDTVTLPSNTGTVGITTDLINDAGTFGVLTLSGGTLNVAADGRIQASGDQRVNAVLNVSGEFQSDGGLDVLREGGGVGVLNVSDNAVLTVAANLDTWWDDGALFTITGPNADIEVGGTFYLGTGARMVANINADSFSTVNVLGNANFPGGNGALEVNFVDGFSPSLGQQWVLFDSPTVGGTIPIWDFPDVGQGRRLSVEYGPGGENGEVVTLEFSTTANLRVNKLTGAVEIDNPAVGASDLDIDGYLIRSGSSALVESEFKGLGAAGWLPGLDPSQSDGLLTETNLNGSTTVAPGNSLFVGNIFKPTGDEDLEFEIHLADGRTIPGTVQYLGILAGDYNEDGVVDAADIDAQAVAMKTPDQNLDVYDENGDGMVDGADRLIWVKTHARAGVGTWVGDSDLNGEFNSGDLVNVFAAGKYETGEMATWVQGDWDGDMAFGSGDLVAAFSDGGYELGPFPPGPAAVPEPSSLGLLSLGILILAWRRRS